MVSAVCTETMTITFSWIVGGTTSCAHLTICAKMRFRRDRQLCSSQTSRNPCPARLRARLLEMTQMDAGDGFSGLHWNHDDRVFLDSWENHILRTFDSLCKGAIPTRSPTLLFPDLQKPLPRPIESTIAGDDANGRWRWFQRFALKP